MKKIVFAFLAMNLFSLTFAQTGSITNIQVFQRTDGSGMVDVYFVLTGQETAYYIGLEASFDGGTNYTAIAQTFLTGDLGPISPGTSVRHIAWNGMGTTPNTYSSQAKVKIIANTSPLGAIIDYDGNIYQTVTIGTQTWMAENLKVTHYRNGDAIPNVTGNSQWFGLLTGAYCWYSNDISWKDAYGALYNWYTVVDSRGLCPASWHTPTDAEWTILTNYLGGTGIAGGKMKSTRTAPDSHPRWNSPNTGATNESGFSGFPGGYRDFDGPFYYIGTTNYFWSSSELGSYNAWIRYMDYNVSYVSRILIIKQVGFSVRCVRD